MWKWHPDKVNVLLLAYCISKTHVSTQALRHKQWPGLWWPCNTVCRMQCQDQHRGSAWVCASRVPACLRHGCGCCASCVMLCFAWDRLASGCHVLASSHVAYFSLTQLLCEGPYFGCAAWGAVSAACRFAVCSAHPNRLDLTAYIYGAMPACLLVCLPLDPPELAYTFFLGSVWCASAAHPSLIELLAQSVNLPRRQCPLKRGIAACCSCSGLVRQCMQSPTCCVYCRTLLMPVLCWPC